MKNTHTPGPWVPDDTADCAHMAQCLMENPTWIAVEDTANDGGHVAYCAPANAMLIAEAPAMLTALRDLVWQLDRTDDLPEEVETMLDDARAILARIDGEGAQ